MNKKLQRSMLVVMLLVMTGCAAKPSRTETAITALTTTTAAPTDSKQPVFATCADDSKVLPEPVVVVEQPAAATCGGDTH